MKDLTKLFIVFVVTLAFYLLGFYAGGRYKQREIENRVKQINKECYTNQDIELIIFNEKQL